MSILIKIDQNIDDSLFSIENRQITMESMLNQFRINFESMLKIDDELPI
jgi:hypothetical protein